MKNNKKLFKRHFRIYFKNNHPAYIVDEEGNLYYFHRVTHSKTSGGKKNWLVRNNPIKNSVGDMYIVKQEQKDNKNRFSKFELELKENVNFDYPEIKKAGSLQTYSRTRYESGKTIKSKKAGKYKSYKNKKR